MTNFLLLICLVASSCFLLTQLFAYYYFDNLRNQHNTGKHTKLLDNVVLFQNILKTLNLHAILADEYLLKVFQETELSHRQYGKHDHETCSLFCWTSSATFIIKGKDLSNQMILIEKFRQVGFTITQQEGYDKREESLEQKYGRYKLLYHLFLQRQQTLIHVLLVYPRNGYEWSMSCANQIMHSTSLPHYATSSVFCNRENVFRPFEYVDALVDGLILKVPKNIFVFIRQVQHSTFVPCNFDQARNFYSTYGYDSTHDSELFRSKANHVLQIVVKILGELDVPFWLSSGTCLGWYRQCDFIPHSRDVDIGIWIKDYKGEIIPAFAEHGLVLKHLFGKIEDSFELSFTIDDLKLDIFFFYEDGDIMWNGGTQVRTGKKFKYIFSKFELCWTSFSFLLVRVPCDTIKYIQANYGEDWNKQVKEWDWKKSPPNVQMNGEWPEYERKKVIQVF